MFEPNEDFMDHQHLNSAGASAVVDSVSNSSTQQMSHYHQTDQPKYSLQTDDDSLISTANDASSATSAMPTTTSTDNDIDQFYQDFLQLEIMPTSSGTTVVTSSSNPVMVTSNSSTSTNNNLNDNINDNNNNHHHHQQQPQQEQSSDIFQNQLINHHHQFDTTHQQQPQQNTPSINDSQPQPHEQPEYHLETLSSCSTSAPTTHNAISDSGQLLVDQQQQQANVISTTANQETTFLYAPAGDNSQSTISTNHHHPSPESSGQQQQQIMISNNNDNNNDSSYLDDVQAKPMKIMKTDDNHTNVGTATGLSTSIMNLVPTAATTTTTTASNTNSFDQYVVDSLMVEDDCFNGTTTTSAVTGANTEVVDDGANSNGVVVGVGSNSNSNSASSTVDFLKNLEVVDDPDTKVVVDQYIQSTTTATEDQSATMITSSSEFQHRQTALQQQQQQQQSTDSKTWFQQPTQNTTQSATSTPTSADTKPEQNNQRSIKKQKTSNKSTKQSNKSLAGQQGDNQTTPKVNNKKISTGTEHSNGTPATTPTSSSSSLSTNGSIGVNGQSQEKNLTPLQSYLQCAANEHNEVPRHTICPLCDNPRSFCSSSSVTRHVRSVHKLADLAESKFSYCILCQQFLEDIHTYYQHLQVDHHFDLEKNFQMLFTKRTFQTLEEFITWKTQELEPQTGCRYEKCFSADYPRSIYYKCSGIEIETMKDESNPNGQISIKEPKTQIVVKYNSATSTTVDNSGTTKVETADLQKIVAAVAAAQLQKEQQQQQQEFGDSPASAEMKANNSGSTQPQQLHLKIDNPSDARMYPCPSSVRLIFKKNHIQVNYIPFHLGHVLTATSAVQTTEQTTQQQQQNESTTPVSTSTPATPKTTKSANNRASTGVSVGSVGKGKKSQKQQLTQGQQIIQTQQTPTQIQQQPVATTTNYLTATTNHPTQMVAIGAAGTHQLAATANSFQFATTGANQKTATTTLQNGTQIVHLPLVNFSNLLTTQGGNLQILTTAPAASQDGQHHASPNQTFQVVAAAPGAKQNIVRLVQAGGAGQKTHFVVQAQATPHSQQHQQLVDVSTQSDALVANHGGYHFNITTTDGQTIQLQPQQTTATQQQAGKPIQLQIRTAVNQHQTQVVNNGTATTYQQVQQAYHQHQVAADSSSTTDLTTMVNAANTTPGAGQTMMIAANHHHQQQQQQQLTSPQQQSTNGLMIVSLEKGMEIVQERFRPRKEHLRMVFEQLLNACLTETDFTTLEQCLQQISNHFQLTAATAANTSTTANAVGTLQPTTNVSATIATVNNR